MKIWWICSFSTARLLPPVVLAVAGSGAGRLDHARQHQWHQPEHGTSRGGGGGSSPGALSSGAAHLESLCILLFELLTAIKRPLLPRVLEACRNVVLRASSRADVCALCCAPLRSIVSTSAPGARKQLLADWMLQLGFELRGAPKNEDEDGVDASAGDEAMVPSTPAATL